MSMVVFAGEDWGRVLVTEFRDTGMVLNGLFCADVLRPLDLVPVTEFTYKYHCGNVSMMMMMVVVAKKTTMTMIQFPRE